MPPDRAQAMMQEALDALHECLNLPPGQELDDGGKLWALSTCADTIAQIDMACGGNPAVARMAACDLVEKLAPPHLRALLGDG